MGWNRAMLSSRTSVRFVRNPSHNRKGYSEVHDLPLVRLQNRTQSFGGMQSFDGGGRRPLSGCRLLSPPAAVFSFMSGQVVPGVYGILERPAYGFR